MSSRRLADVYKLTHLSFQLLLPLDSLPLVGQSIGIRHNNRSRHSRTSRPMMADGNEATSLVLREIASICKGPCTPGTGNSRHIWQTSSGYLSGTSGGRLGDVWGTSTTRNCLEVKRMTAGCPAECKRPSSAPRCHFWTKRLKGGTGTRLCTQQMSRGHLKTAQMQSVSSTSTGYPTPGERYLADV